MTQQLAWCLTISGHDLPRAVSIPNDFQWVRGEVSGKKRRQRSRPERRLPRRSELKCQRPPILTRSNTWKDGVGSGTVWTETSRREGALHIERRRKRERCRRNATDTKPFASQEHQVDATWNVFNPFSAWFVVLRAGSR